MSDTSTETESFVILAPDFQRHMDKVNACVGTLNGIMTALAANPMFAGFLPAELREQISHLSD
jgi:hypothetical protein